MRATIWTNSLCCTTSQSMTARAYMPSSWNAEWVSSMPGRYCVLGWSGFMGRSLQLLIWHMGPYGRRGGPKSKLYIYIYSFSNITWCSVYSMFQHFFLSKGTPHLLSSNFGIRRPTKQDMPHARPSFKSGMHHNSASSSVLMAGITQPHFFHGTPCRTLQGRCFSPKFCMACMARIHKYQHSLIAW